MRFEHPGSGALRCGETDLLACDTERWRDLIAWVPQQPTLFSGTLEENIRLGNPTAGAQRLRAALRATGADEIVASLPDGLDTVVGETGRRLSAGQRQRIALARAFLRDAPILVLDEPTAHLDEHSAASVGAAIERVAAGRTTLLIVHHPSLARRASRVVTLSAGRVVADYADEPVAA
jgi:ABC-type multidrug transport system fused ATPase/permease subunit